MTPPRHHSIKIAGSRLHYWVYGPNRNAPVIVAIHGFRGTHHGLERIIEHLPEYTVIVPDLPGFGESTPMDDYAHDIDGYAELFKRFIPAVTGPGDDVYLLGHSFGSIVASNLVAGSLPGIRKLILINPIARRPSTFGRLATVAYFTIGLALGENGARRFFGWPVAVNAMSRTLTKSHNRMMKAYVKAQHLGHFAEYATRRTLRESFRASVTQTVGDYASRLRIPVLLIAGDADAIAPLRDQRALYDRLDTPVELAVIEHVGHLVHYEKPAEAAGYIQAFIRED